MLSHGRQVDAFRPSPHRQATAEDWREAARTARKNPFETPDASERRARHYEHMADIIEAAADR